MLQSNEAKYRVAAIGCGRKGTEHARAYYLNPLTDVVAAADTDSENLDLFCRRFNVPGYSDHNEMLCVEEVDIVSTILPVSSNPQVVIDCARSGAVRAICCEKPMAASLEDADRMFEECQARGIKLGCGDLERNHPDYWKAHRIIESGELGKVRSISFTQGSGSQMSGGGCQVFSLIRLFAGDTDGAWVLGWVDGDASSDYDQGGAGYIRFVNGIEAFVHRGGTAKFGFEVLCERGLFHSDGRYLHMWKSEGGMEQSAWTDLKKMEGVFSETEILHQGFGTIDDEGWERGGARQHATIQSMVNALEMDVEPSGNGDNGRKVLEMAIAIRESHYRGHIPVKLPLEDRSLRMIPVPGRWLNKKEVYGREWYTKQLDRFTRS